METSLLLAAREPSRRRVLLALGALPVLASCGGGGGTPPLDDAPAIDAFSADTAPVFVGDSTRLTAVFRGGAGTIDPGAVPVASGTPVTVGPLAQSATYTLRVQSARGSVQRSLAVEVAFRNRYAAGPAFTVSQHAASVARDGSVIVIGGSRGQSTLADGIDRFDPATRTFQRIGALASGRASHRATALAGGGILVTGGLRVDGGSRIAELVNDATGASATAGTLSVTRVDHAVVQLPDDRVLVTGGSSTGERAPLGISSSAEIWDPVQRSFRRLGATMLLPRSGHSMTVLPNGKVLVAGGYTPGSPYLFAEVFDPATESFTAVADTAPLRASHAAHLLPDGRVLLLGGETLAADLATPVPLASVLAYDAAAGRLANLPPLAAPRTWAASVALPAGEILLFGGQSELPHYTASAERYSASAGGTPIAALDGERALHSAHRLPDGRIAVIGGEAWGGAYRSGVQIYE